MSKTTLTILIIVTLLQSCIQPTKQSGLLILDYRRTDTSYDIFIPCEIDEKKTLEENIRSIKTDTAKWVSLAIIDNYADVIDKSKKIENDGNETMAEGVRYKKVVPAYIEIDKDHDGRQYGEFDFGEYEIKFMGQVISPGVDVRQVLTLSKVQIIRTK